MSFNEDNFLGQRRETQIIALILMSLAFKLMKAATPEEGVAMFFMFTKLGSIVLFMFVDRRFAVFYGLLCFVLWLILK